MPSVTPLAGVRIEIARALTSDVSILSPPSRG